MQAQRLSLFPLALLNYTLIKNLLEAEMTLEAIVGLISNFGFPIAVLISGAYWVKGELAHKDRIIKAKDEEIKQMITYMREGFERDIQLQEKRLEADVRHHAQIEQLVKEVSEIKTKIWNT